MNTEADVLAALAKRYPAGQWVFLSHVRSSTGFDRNLRTIDAMALNMWPSQGLELHGFEIKVSRADWLTEMRTPEKAERICQYCDRFWLVVADESIVKPAELPTGWGLLVPRVRTLSGLRALIQAPDRGRQELPRGFVASLLRRAFETDEKCLTSTD